MSKAGCREAGLLAHKTAVEEEEKEEEAVWGVYLEGCPVAEGGEWPLAETPEATEVGSGSHHNRESYGACLDLKGGKECCL